MGRALSSVHTVTQDIYKGGTPTHHIRCPLSWQTPRLIGDCKLLCSTLSLFLLSAYFKLSIDIKSSVEQTTCLLRPCWWTGAVFRTREQGGTSAVITPAHYTGNCWENEVFPVAGTRLQTCCWRRFLCSSESSPLAGKQIIMSSYCYVK